MTLPGAAPMPLSSTGAGCRFQGRALGVPLCLRHLDLGAGSQNGDTALRPGAWLFVALVAGGRLIVAGPGEQMEIHATQPLWARVYFAGGQCGPCGGVGLCVGAPGAGGGSSKRHVALGATATATLRAPASTNQGSDRGPE